MKQTPPAPTNSNIVQWPTPVDPLKKGGGGGTFDGMEHRVEKLEAKMDKVEDRLTSIDTTLALINEKLDSKPGHWAVLALNATLLGLVLAAIGFGARVL